MTAVLVIGMHRSGTSLVAGALKLVGAYLGPESDLMQPSPENAKGYWEHLGFVEIDEKFLDLLGGSWYRPPALSASALSNAAVEAVQDEARQLISEQFARHPLWACKDPRATILLPLWRPLVSDPRFVLCVRNPLDVASSLKKRDGLPIEHGAALWHVYTLQGLLDTKPSERVIVFYEAILQNPLDALSPVFTLIGASDRFSDPDVRKSLEGFTDTRLEHHRHSIEDLDTHPGVLRETRRLYKALLAKDAAEIEAAIAGGEAALEIMYAITSGYGLAQEARKEAAQLRHELEKNRAELQNARDILNSRTHRAASAANDWLIRVRKSRSDDPKTP